jgi:precorrin-2/cobalt-factor-2 C20-methyltransferase
MLGTLYVIGVGPGDPELLTLKAVRILNEVPVICVPKGKEDGSSLALSIVSKALNLSGKDIIEAHFPMQKTKSSENECELDTKWHNTVENVLSRLNRGIDTAFITMGDPSIYSTFFYLYDRILELNPAVNIEIIPGVSSINAAASKAKLSLGLADEKIAILPATYADNLKETLEKFDTVVLMKVHKVFDKVSKILDEMNLVGNAIYISRAGMDDELIIRDIKKIKKENLNYFSMLIIRRTDAREKK